MKAHRLIVTFAAVASVVALVGAGAAATTGAPDWLDALNARSAALNEQHGLGNDTRRRTLEAPGANWRQALTARSEAMNREYGLGKYARRAERSSSTPDWLAALNARSDALNELHGLGDYAPER